MRRLAVRPAGAAGAVAVLVGRPAVVALLAGGAAVALLAGGAAATQRALG